MLERVWRKGNPLTLLVGMQTSTATMENSVEIPLKAGTLILGHLMRKTDSLEKTLMLEKTEGTRRRGDGG